MKIRKNDTVVVISGKDKGKKGKVIKVFPEEGRVVVEGVNIIKRHKKVNLGNTKDPGGIIEKPAPIDVSNVMYYDSSASKATRVGYKIDKDGKKWRETKKTKKVIK